jgi:hypothetical protein
MGCRSRPRFEWDTDFTDFTDFFLRADSRTGSRFDFVVARWVAGDGLVLVGHGFHGFHGFLKKGGDAFRIGLQLRGGAIGCRMRPIWISNGFSVIDQPIRLSVTAMTKHRRLRCLVMTD